MDTQDVRPIPPPDTHHPEIARDDAATGFRPSAPVDPAARPDPSLPPAPDDDPLGPVFTDDTLDALVQALTTAGTNTDTQKLRRKAAAMHLLRSLDVQQPVEAALATQAVLFHYASLGALRRAAVPDQFSAISNREIGSAARASALFSRLLHELAWQQRPMANARPPRNKPR